MSPGEGRGWRVLPWEPFSVWADQRTFLVQDRRLAPALEFASLLPCPTLRPRSSTGPPCRAGPGAQEHPEALPSSLSFPPPFTLHLFLFFPVLFSFSVKDKNFSVALDTVDTNARVRGQGWIDGKELSQSSSRWPPSQGRGLAGTGGSDLLARPLQCGSLFSLPVL